MVVQGKVTATRRDYSGILVEAARYGRSRFNFTVCGASDATNSKKTRRSERELVTKLAAVSTMTMPRRYISFYRTIAQHAALYPAFCKDQLTLTIKASSTIACALIAGVPLVATKKILAVYDYLEEAAVWLVPDSGSSGTSVREEENGKGNAVWSWS